VSPLRAGYSNVAWRRSRLLSRSGSSIRATFIDTSSLGSG
jgi:hypothetical protein